MVTARFTRTLFFFSLQAAVCVDEVPVVLLSLRAHDASGSLRSFEIVDPIIGPVVPVRRQAVIGVLTTRAVGAMKRGIEVVDRVVPEGVGNLDAGRVCHRAKIP